MELHSRRNKDRWFPEARRLVDRVHGGYCRDLEWDTVRQQTDSSPTVQRFIVQVGALTRAGTDAIYATYVNQRENTARRS